MSGTFQALGWTLIHFCWQATAIAGLYLAVNLSLRKTNSHTRYLFTVATLFSMFIVSVATLGYETARCSAKTSFPVSNSPAPVRVTFSVGTETVNVDSSTLPLAHIQWAPVLPWIDFAWFLGVLCFSIRSIGGWWWLEGLRRKTLDEAPEAVHATFVKVCERLGIAWLPDLRISERVSVPMTFGILRSLVLLPASALLSLSPDQLEVIFAHELAHVRRGDYFWNLMQTALETLFFYHPAVWWIGRRLREQRELCCDDIALELCADPLGYATALLRLEEQRLGGLNLAMALDGHQSRSNFLVRVQRILGEALPQPHKRALRPLSLIGVCVSLCLFLSPMPKVFGGRSLQDPPQPQQQMLSRQQAPQERRQAKQVLAELRPTPAPAQQVIAPVQGSKAGVAQLHLSSKNLVASQISTNSKAHENSDYMSQMRAAGYDLIDVSQYRVLKENGIAPKYAQQMANLGFGRPSVGALLVMKAQRITPEYLSSLRAEGLELRNVDALISARLFHITPEFIKGMKAVGYDSIPERTLRNLCAAHVTLEYARSIKQQFPKATPQQLIQLGALHIDENFIALARSRGIEPLTIQTLIELRGSGALTDDN